MTCKLSGGRVKMSRKNRKKIKLPSQQASLSLLALASSPTATTHKQLAEGFNI